MKKCIQCGKKLATRHQIKYCSIRCQTNYKYQKYIEDWQSGIKNGNIGLTAISISRHLKRYLREKYGERCSECGWNKIHAVTGRVPLEVDHIDGNAENNDEKNLMLLCPNCHSLTINYRALNMGKGRKWRTKNS